MLQTILIPRNKFTLAEAKQWIKDHGHKLTFYGKPFHKTTHYYRFKQNYPNASLSYRTKTFKNGIKFVTQ